jgi:hypothetical protein
VSPSFTNSNPTTAVKVPFVVAGVQASRLYCSPATILWSPFTGLAVRSSSSSGFEDVLGAGNYTGASTTSRMATAKVAAGHNRRGAAVALSKPLLRLVGRGNYDELTEAAPGHFYSSHASNCNPKHIPIETIK